jgi:hypothetical protein
MAEFKTAEQYVVEKLETTERELEGAKRAYDSEVVRNAITVKALKEELDSAYELLNMLREFVSVRDDDYFGEVVHFDTIYGKEHPEVVAKFMEYYDIRTKENENDE